MPLLPGYDERVVVVGAGPCGLALARQLEHEQGIDALVLDRADAPASTWRGRYDGFRLNTCGFWSHLPGQRIPRRHGRWPGRDEMVNYFDDYVSRQRLRLRLRTTVRRVDRDRAGWIVRTESEALHAAAVIVATGNYHTPVLPPWPGEFSGLLVHSVDYRNALPYKGQDVLVVGSGNSATDIVLQLSGGVARRVRMAIRTPPHLVPRSAAGVPVDAFSGVFSHLPVAVLDHAAAVMQRVRFGDLSRQGLPVPRRGIYSALLEDGHIPTLGDGLGPRVKDGSVEVVAAVESLDGDGVVLTDGTTVRPDAVIAATGFRHGLESMIGHLGVLDDAGDPLADAVPSAAPGLWLAGYDEPLIGPLRSFRLQASAIADDVARHLGGVGRT